MNTCFSIVTSDFVLTGGMDRANYALADYIARQGKDLHLVAHRVAPELIDRSNVTFDQVPKPLNSYSLGSPLLSRRGMRVCSALSQTKDMRSIVNGGNCPYPDINWVHYVHAAYTPDSRTGIVANVKKQIDRRIDLKGERVALQGAKMVIANSMLTQNHLIDLLDLEPSKIKTIYYGIDANVFYPPTLAEREKLRGEYDWELERPIVTFIGALGDRRKGFDTIHRLATTLSRPHLECAASHHRHRQRTPPLERTHSSSGFKRSNSIYGFPTRCPLNPSCG
jgi:glycosyltransferase involved in cell wall biosynthesis